ncbi:hypothetical protein BYT27DRAFT_7112035 [Phlegmacium glaucopus]|nr:hypothetical protein BYT27DRAFT_7112035 [Phlegmacium glaucopus]
MFPSVESACFEPVADPSKRIRDVDYFMEPIFILVQDTIFHIPKHYFTHIGIFSTVFSLPPNEDGPEGLTEERPFILHQISKRDFKAFLRVIMPIQIPHSYSNITVDEWTSTLNLSTMWEVTALRDLAIRHLNQLLNTVDMILYGYKYRVSQWFITGCTNLIKRGRGLTDEEGERLGVRFAIQIYEIRERSLLFRLNQMPQHDGKPAAQFEYQRAVQALSDKIFD